MIELEIVNKSNNKTPTNSTKYSAGLDLRADLQTKKLTELKGYRFEANIDHLTMYAGGRVLVPTGLYMQIPEGFVGDIRPRSGLALNYGITVLNAPGTIDSDYRGEIGVILHNTSDDLYTIHHGDRIAQLVITPYESVAIVVADGLSDTSRGEGGFGSTGKK